MLKEVFDIDTNGFIRNKYVAEVDIDGIILDSEKQHLISAQPIVSFFKAKWTGSEWIEGATQEEINSINNVNEVITTPSTENFLLDLDYRLSVIEMGL